MKRFRHLGILMVALILWGVPGLTQLSARQRQTDFGELAAAVSRNYAPSQAGGYGIG